MKKLLISIATLLLIGSGYFTYEKWVKHSDLTAWSFIPSDAALVLEGRITKDLDTFCGYPVSTILQESSGFSNFREGLSFLDSINGQGGFASIFKNTPALASLHKVSNNELDFLFVVELQNISQNTFANAAVGRLQKSGYRFKTRNYNDFKISEISNMGKTLTFIFFKNFFVASFTPYLVEDAVRVISEGELLSFRNSFLQLENVTESAFGSVYVNYKDFGELAGAIGREKIDFPLLTGGYELVQDSSFIQLSGFSYASDGWITTHNQQPSTFDMAEVVPENTASFYHITSSNFSDWKEKQISYLRKNNPEVRTYQDSLKKAYDFNSDQVFDLIDNEIGIASLESPRRGDNHKLLIFEVKNREESLSFFSQLTERIALARDDTVYSESYSENEIRFLPVSEFPSTILGKPAYGFSQCFYIGYRNYLIFSNDLEELKKLISLIGDEATWGKSLRMNRFLERANKTANLSLFVNVPRAWNTIQNGMKEEWKDHFKDNSEVYKSLEMAAFQYSYADGRYFTNYTFSQPVKSKINIPKTSPEDGIRFAGKITSKPHLLRTHAHKNFDILVQDSTNIIYYLDPEQNTRWTLNPEEAILGNIYPVDYYKNGKIQYLFATSKAVHIVDRNGAYIPGYPKAAPQDQTIVHINLIDYDKSRNYRIAVSADQGDVFLTDKDLKTLEGWNPKKLKRKGLLPLNHARLGRTDIMISIQENGTINVMNRRGNFLKGFPFEMKQQLSADYHLRRSNSLSNSSLTVITVGGELIELNLEGDVIKRDQLIKTSADTRFQLITDRSGSSFIIVRNEGNTYEVLDDTGNLLFKKDYLSDGPILVQYYQFGAGKDLIVFTDKAKAVLYIYDKSGNLVTGNPLNSEHEISLIYSGANREFRVFTTWGPNLELFRFNY